MRTFGNNNPFNGSEYYPENNTASYYVDGYVVAHLDFNTDTFEQEEDMTDDDADFYYDEMTRDKNTYYDHAI